MKYRFVVEKHYQVEADNYDEAIEKINSEQEYSYVVDENWQLLDVEGEGEGN
jgi:hypothetical protein